MFLLIIYCTAIHWAVYNCLDVAVHCLILQNSIDLNKKNVVGVSYFFLFNASSYCCSNEKS